MMIINFALLQVKYFPMIRNIWPKSTNIFSWTTLCPVIRDFRHFPQNDTQVTPYPNHFTIILVYVKSAHSIFCQFVPESNSIYINLRLNYHIRQFAGASNQVYINLFQSLITLMSIRNFPLHTYPRLHQFKIMSVYVLINQNTIM